MGAQTAQVQFIHNSSDNAIPLVAVWMNDELWTDSLHYHEATSFISVPASDSINWDIRSATDSSVIYYTWTSYLETDSKNIFTLHGHVQSTYQPFQPLSVEHFNQALNLSASSGSADILFFHGASDLDTIDIAETELFELTAFDQLPYGRFSGYINLFPADFGWSMFDVTGISNLGEFSLPIPSLNWSGKAITIVTGGFYNQANNNNGQALGLWATTGDGGPMVCLQPMQWNLNANVQFLHNASLPASQNIRIKVDSIDWQSSVSEHSSTPFAPFPAGKDVILSIHSNLLGSPLDSLWSDTLHLFSGNRYQLIWYGGFTSESPARLLVHEYADYTAPPDQSLRVQFFHGASQWQTISLIEDTVTQTPLFESIPFGFMSDTLTLPTVNEEWLLFSAIDSITALSAPLDTLNLNQQTITMLTSDEWSDDVISAWFCYENGGPMHHLSALTIPETPIFCDVQLVHASSDTMLHSVNVWVNDSLLFPNFQFESASVFTPVQCNNGVIIRITQVDNVSSVLFTDTLMLTPSQQHRLILWGIFDSPHYNPAPELTWYIDENFYASSIESGNTDIRFFHTVADIGDIQVNEASIPVVPFYNEVEVGEMSYIQSVAANENYGIELLNAPSQFLYDSYALPVLEQGWENRSVTLISTGFRQPANNSNGEPLEVWSLLPDGSMSVLPQFVLTENTRVRTKVSIVPNPAQESVRLIATSFGNGWATLHLIGPEGEILLEKKCLTMGGAINESINVQSIPSGIYNIRITSDTNTHTLSLVIQH